MVPLMLRPFSFVAAEDVRDIVVEIESRCIKKPFVGGYKHKATGIEYHHAFTQTPSMYYKVSAQGMQMFHKNGKRKEKFLPKNEEISRGKAHTNTRKLICYIWTITDIFLNQKTVNVCEHVLKMVSCESF